MAAGATEPVAPCTIDGIAPAHAELVFFSNCRNLSVKEHRIEQVHLVLEMQKQLVLTCPKCRTKYNTVMFKKAPPERLKELLRIANWLAAPFGSAEDLLLTAGAVDVDYKLDADGRPVLADGDDEDGHLGLAGAVGEVAERLRRALGAAAVAEDNEALHHVIHFAVEHRQHRVADVGGAQESLVQFHLLTSRQRSR